MNKWKAKIQNLAEPNQIMAGQGIYNKLDSYMKEFFSDITDDLISPLQYYSDDQNKIYRIYRYEYQ